MARPTAEETEGAYFRLLATSGIDLMVQMPVLAACVHRLFPSFSLSMIRVDAAAAPREHYSEHFDEVSHQLFSAAGDQFAASSDDPAAFGRLLRNPVPYGTLIQTSAKYQAGATYQQLFRRNGIHHCLDVAVRDASGPLGILGIFRERGTRPFDDADVARTARLYDHLVHAFSAPPLPADFDEIEGALVVVDARHRIVWASSAARAWLESATPGPDRARLMSHHTLPDACQALSRGFRKSFSTRHGRTAPLEAPTLTLPIAGGRLRLRAYSLAAVDPESMTSHIGIQLSLEMHRELRVLRVLTAYALPPQQRRLAVHLYRGASGAAIAHDLGIGAATLKSYRRELYARVGVEGSEQLRAELDRRARDVRLDLTSHLPRRPTSAPPA